MGESLYPWSRFKAGCPILMASNQMSSLASTLTLSLVILWCSCAQCSPTAVSWFPRLRWSFIQPVSPVNVRNPITAVGEHCAHKHHKITKDSVRILPREDIWLKRKVRELEAIKIKIGQPAMNRDQWYDNYCCHVIVVKAVT